MAESYSRANPIDDADRWAERTRWILRRAPLIEANGAPSPIHDASELLQAPLLCTVVPPCVRRMSGARLNEVWIRF